MIVASCKSNGTKSAIDASQNTNPVQPRVLQFKGESKTIHVLVALCDNHYQGIVPVPPKIGNGQDADNNLYWGTSYGIRTYFKNSKEWKLIQKTKLSGSLLERIVFKHQSKNYYLVADAYDGRYIKQTTIDFLKSCSGQMKDTLKINNTVIGLYGNARLLSYIGHDGLMDFTIDDIFENADGQKRDAIILACYSKGFFTPHLKATGVDPLVWTTGLMAPEAYTLHDALRSYVNNESAQNIRSSAFRAYSKYQKCSQKAAANLLVNGY